MTLDDCPEGYRYCDLDTGECAGWCDGPGGWGCACHPDGTCDERGTACLTRDAHWDCTEDCVCTDTSWWVSAACDVAECNNECAVAQREDYYASFEEILVSFPAECAARTVPEGIYDAVADVGEGEYRVVVELAGGGVLAVDDLPCEEVFPGQTLATNAEMCERLFRCGCCYWWLGPALSGTGFAVTHDGLFANSFDCGYRGFSYYIGGEWVPPSGDGGKTPDGCGDDWGCCEHCGDTCSYCDAIRDMECFRQCYGECHRCCLDCL